ncbi:thiol reductase thioredoxin, partial [bacterium]
KDGEVASQYGVMSIPALMVFKGGKVVAKKVGADGGKRAIATLIDGTL